MTKNKKGFTLVELLAVIIVLSILMVLIIPEVTKIIKKTQLKSIENSTQGLMRAIRIAKHEYALDNEMEGLIFTFHDGNEEANVPDLKLNYTGKKPQNGKIIIGISGKIGLVFHDGKYCIEKKYENDNIIITEKKLENCNFDFQLDKDISGANKPVLLNGMTPIIWDENKKDWIKASNIDDPYEQNWYDYEKKQWANAKTEDGSFWVWIPRYAYKIINGFHSNVSGTIDIKFLNETSNNSKDNTEIKTEGYNGETNNTSMHYFLHPAFKFGENDIPGFWVAKFEPSGDINNIQILPQKDSLNNMKIKVFYMGTLKMKNYICSNNCDTHMMKNTEWGAVAYLTQSEYGINGKLDQNTSSTSTGGIDYTNNKQQSTTGTIYGIYDMSGGKWEYTMGVMVDSSNNRLVGYSDFSQDELNKIPNKYIDDYTTYDDAKNLYGDAIYETSSSDGGLNSWHGEESDFVTTYHDSFWFGRGSHANSSSYGIFTFVEYDGYFYKGTTFRPVAIR